jgi:phosphoglycolate phosphatase
MNKLAIFDLDGTLINSIGDIADSANAVLTKNGFPILSEHRYREVVGWGLENMIRAIVPQEKHSIENINRYCLEYREYYRDNWHNRTAPYEGIPELLLQLSKKGVKLAVLSNKRDDFTNICVKHFFPDTNFVDIRGERPGTPPKPNPEAALDIAQRAGIEPARCVFIGDSEIDIETALKSSMLGVGVLWGFRDRVCLESAGAPVIITEPEEILGFF